jgi:hypothetical protein
MYPARIGPFLRVDGVARKAESPRPRKGKCSEQYRKVPPAPPETRNRKHQKPSSDEPHEARLAHPARRLGLQQDVAQRRYQQENSDDVDISRFGHSRTVQSETIRCNCSPRTPTPRGGTPTFEFDESSERSVRTRSSAVYHTGGQPLSALFTAVRISSMVICMS